MVEERYVEQTCINIVYVFNNVWSSDLGFYAYVNVFAVGQVEIFY